MERDFFAKSRSGNGSAKVGIGEDEKSPGPNSDPGSGIIIRGCPVIHRDLEGPNGNSICRCDC